MEINLTIFCWGTIGLFVLSHLISSNIRRSKKNRFRVGKVNKEFRSI